MNEINITSGLLLFVRHVGRASPRNCLHRFVYLHGRSSIRSSPVGPSIWDLIEERPFFADAYSVGATTCLGATRRARKIIFETGSSPTTSMFTT